MRFLNTRSVAAFILLVLTLIVLWTFIEGIGDFGASAEAEQLQSIQSIIERASIQCYALEGGFPPTLDHLVNYGVVLNYDKFAYVYDSLGSNIMPTIRVTALK